MFSKRRSVRSKSENFAKLPNSLKLFKVLKILNTRGPFKVLYTINQKRDTRESRKIKLDFDVFVNISDPTILYVDIEITLKMKSKLVMMSRITDKSLHIPGI